MITILWSMFAGCAPIIVAWPPAPMMPTMTAPVEHGDVELGLGVNGLIATANFDREPAVSGQPTRDVSTTWLPFGGGVGVADGTDIAVQMGPAALGSTYQAQVGQRVWSRDTVRIDALGGLGVVLSDAIGDFYTAASYDSDGDGIQNLEIEHEARYYVYWALAPMVGARATFTPHPAFVVPVYARGSWSFTVPVLGLDDYSMPNQPYWEVGSAAVWRPGKVVELGGGVSLLGGEPFAFFRANASVSMRLGAFGPHKTKE